MYLVKLKDQQEKFNPASRNTQLTARHAPVTIERNQTISSNQMIKRRPNDTGFPDNLTSGVERSSDDSMGNVKVHCNSNKPAQLQAHADAQGTDIHLGTGQGKYVPNEAGPVTQQKQVRPVIQMYGDDDDLLEIATTPKNTSSKKLRPSMGVSVAAKRLQELASWKSRKWHQTTEKNVGIPTVYGITSNPRYKRRIDRKPTNFLGLVSVLKEHNYNWFALKEVFAYKQEGQSDEDYRKNFDLMKVYVGLRKKKVTDFTQTVIKSVKDNYKQKLNKKIDLNAPDFGSSTPTSDIDLTFTSKTDPESEIDAAQQFNKRFVKEYGVASGVMLDTNVYVSGFLPNDNNKFKDELLIDADSYSDMANNVKVLKEKNKIQLGLSYVSILQYYHEVHPDDWVTNWDGFKSESKKNMNTFFDKKIQEDKKKSTSDKLELEKNLKVVVNKDIDDVFNKAEVLYQKTTGSFTKKQAETTLKKNVNKYIKKEDSRDFHIKSIAKDRLYIDALVNVKECLKQLKINETKLEPFLSASRTKAAEKTNAMKQDNTLPKQENNDLNSRDDLLDERGRLIIKFNEAQGIASIYSNEAYFSKGAVNHVVRGMQGGHEVELGGNQQMQSLIMNVGYKLQHYHHNKKKAGLGRAMIDTSKYGYRIGHLIAKGGADEERSNSQLQLWDSLSMGAQDALKRDKEILSNYKKSKVAAMETPHAKENKVVSAFGGTQENVEKHFLEIGRKVLGPYYWDQYVTHKKTYWE